MTRRVNQVDQEIAAISFLGNVLKVFFMLQLSIEGNCGRFDGDAAVLFILTRIRKSGFPGLRGRDDTGTLNQRIGESGLSVVN
jgi:hypothetical protein